MNFQELRKDLFDYICFTTNQVNAWHPGFDKNNLGRWVKKGYLIKLRNGYYSFPEYLGKQGYSLFLANRIYKPSYISTHSALVFYGMIPESVVQITSVTSLKTAAFDNSFGQFSYRAVNPSCYFGYDIKPFDDGRSILMACPEKALLDLLYLNPFYSETSDFQDLRLDEEFVFNHLNTELLRDFAGRVRKAALERRVETLLKAYGL
jgi:predicted transcriptional regulator of viral defense system